MRERRSRSISLLRLVRSLSISMGLDESCTLQEYPICTPGVGSALYRTTLGRARPSRRVFDWCDLCRIAQRRCSDAAAMWISRSRLHERGVYWPNGIGSPTAQIGYLQKSGWSIIIRYREDSESSVSIQPMWDHGGAERDR